MITVTIKDVLEETLSDCSEHFIYRFYDGETTFYIGKSFEIEERLCGAPKKGSAPEKVHSGAFSQGGFSSEIET